MTASSRGRPRSAALHDAILAATRSLITEFGYAEVTMDRVAARAGVGKQSVYRRWPSKAPLIAEAIVDAFRGNRPLRISESDDIAADLVKLLDRLAVYESIPANAACLRALAAAAAEDPNTGQALYAQITGTQHEAVILRLRRGIDMGQIREEVDLEAVADAVIGAFLYRLLAHPTGGSEAVVRSAGLVDALIAGAAPRRTSGK